jgi:opacity protein-like surface antigen
LRIGPKWGVYARYETVDGARTQDEFTQWVAGFSYRPVPDVTVKVDYRSREHVLATEAGRDFGALDLGIGYQF